MGGTAISKVIWDAVPVLGLSRRSSCEQQKWLLFAGLILLSHTAYSGDDVHWSYGGAEGPENWGRLSPEFAMCAEGRNQSPIDLSGFVDAELKPIEFAYEPGGKEVWNNGHTIQVNYAPGSMITIDNHEFELRQFHFHAPSEDTIEGRSYALEAHLVHVDAEGNVAVVAVLFEEGASNATLDKAWQRMPEKAGEPQPLPAPIDASGMLPRDREYYRFNGSLTTPPCTEGVRWLVMKNAITASKEQVEKFSQVMQHPTNRPLQPLNARLVLQ